MIGGTGFVGRHVAQALARDGHHLRILTRRRERHRGLLVLPRVELVEGNVHLVSDLTALLRGCDAVINLAGILNQGPCPTQRFQAVHAALPGKIVEACAFNGCQRLLHMSALGASADAASEYLRSKAAGEAAVHAATSDGIAVTSFQPSVIFGPGDSFFNRFAALLRWSPVLPLACAEARFAPVYVGDVAQAFARALADPATAGERYPLCGPEVFTLRELVAYTSAQLGLRRTIIGLGDGLSRLQARLFEFVPGQPFTRDNYLAMQHDSVCSEDGRARLGIDATPVSASVPDYLTDGPRAKLFRRLRATAGRAPRERL